MTATTESKGPKSISREKPYGRLPPAYQHYASDWLAREDIKLLSHEALALLHTLRDLCWVGVGTSIPRSPAMLSRLIGWTEAEIEQCFPEIAHFFPPLEGDHSRIHNPDLTIQMGEYMRKRVQKVDAAKGRWGKKSNLGNDAPDDANAYASASQADMQTDMHAEKSREEQSKDVKSVCKKESIHRDGIGVNNSVGSAVADSSAHKGFSAYAEASGADPDAIVRVII